MRFENYDHKSLEPQILDFWDKNKTVEKRRARNKKGKRFYFLEGPPYTSGRVHLGTAWNMALKDIFLRYKRMKGYNVWDRMGYDMHGLPTEQKVMATLKLNDKEDIESFGIQKFTAECERFCKEMMQAMSEDFLRLGATLDFSNPYQPITREFMDAEWWLIAEAHKKKRLYRGLRTMHWDAATQSSVAKHELEYRQVTDTSIFMKFPHKEKNNTYFIIWTTTPWTIPLNLAIMVNPDVAYTEVDIGKETWIVADELLESVMRKAGIKKYAAIKTYQGRELKGEPYTHPLKTSQYLPEALRKNPNVFTLILTSEYVDTSAGTGLVHCAPGCGPEDYEVGHQNGIPPFNCVDETGFFRGFGQFTGYRAKVDDPRFIDAIEEAGALVAKEQYTHEYPYGERSHQPVIFRTTTQWFFKVEDLKEKMIIANNAIRWVPQAGYNAFNAWLENLRDNSITKQRYWGTPVPIWQAEDNDYMVMGSAAELERLSGKNVKNMHIPDIDKITIEKNGKVYRRIPDVLDVWIDAGTASWNCLGYPTAKTQFKELFPADFILEGKDQIRGWFNLLMVASFLAFGKPSFKAVYMHGFLNDISGVKMSKSLDNIISPHELIEKHGADVLRYYMCQNSAGEDINFSWEECATKAKQLHIFWNLHKLLLAMAHENSINPFTIRVTIRDGEERYILSRLHSTIKRVTELFEEYRLDETIVPLEELFLDLSRTYIQMVREKSSVGSEGQKKACISTIATVFFECLKMFSVIAPFISEAIYQNLQTEFNLTEESISHYGWPSFDPQKIDSTLEQQVQIIQSLTQGALNAREKAKLGLRWPVKEIVIMSSDEEVIAAVTALQPILETQTNAKKIVLTPKTPRGLYCTAEAGKATIYLNVERTPALEEEGFAREMMRKVQSLRKKAGLEKKDRISVTMRSPVSLSRWRKEIMEKVGAETFIITEKAAEKGKGTHHESFTVKDKTFEIWFSVV